MNESLHYALNGNKVPLSEGCRPLMDLGEGIPDDLDHKAYFIEAVDLLQDVGYNDSDF